MGVVPYATALLLFTAAQLGMTLKGPPDQRARWRRSNKVAGMKVGREAGSRRPRDPPVRDGRRRTVQRSGPLLHARCTA
jgi:hypothetical protein